MKSHPGMAGRFRSTLPGNFVYVSALAAIAFAGALLPDRLMAQPAGGQGATGEGATNRPPVSFGAKLIPESELKLLSALPRPTADAEPPSTDPRNLEGTYLMEGLPAFRPRSLPAYTEKGKAMFEAYQKKQMEAQLDGRLLLTNSGRCRPSVGIGIGADQFPAEITQSKDKVVVFLEEFRLRWIIHLNGSHPANLKPSYMGHAIGRWEGDTLVVDTVGLIASDGGRLNSEKVRFESRLRKTNGGRNLELQTTTYDPEIYAKPVEGGTAKSYWHPQVQMLEFQCEEDLEGAREGMEER